MINAFGIGQIVRFKNCWGKSGKEFRVEKRHFNTDLMRTEYDLSLASTNYEDQYKIICSNVAEEDLEAVREDVISNKTEDKVQVKTKVETSQGCIPADFDIVQLRNGDFYQYFKSMNGYIKLIKDSYGSKNFMIDNHYENNELNYIDCTGKHRENCDIMKIYRGIATYRVLTAPASELKRYEVWSRLEPYLIPEKLIKTALKDFVGFEEEDIKVDEKNRFYIDGAIVGDSARKFIENEEWKKPTAYTGGFELEF